MSVTVHVFHPRVQIMVGFRRVLCCFLLAENAGLRQRLKILEGTIPYTQMPCISYSLVTIFYTSCGLSSALILVLIVTEGLQYAEPGKTGSQV